MHHSHPFKGSVSDHRRSNPRLHLADSDRGETEEQRRLNNWRAGYTASETVHADDYQRGYIDGILARKHEQHDILEQAKLETIRWGPGGREHFGDPRPGEYQGGPVAPW